MIDTDRCETMLGGMRCTLTSGHDVGDHPTPHHAEVAVADLSPDLSQLIAGWIDTVEAERAGYTRAKRWMWTAFAANILAAAVNLLALAQK
jgi:hypothetical protein